MPITSDDCDKFKDQRMCDEISDGFEYRNNADLYTEYLSHSRILEPTFSHYVFRS